jgi:hypothetical protein
MPVITTRKVGYHDAAGRKTCHESGTTIFTAENLRTYQEKGGKFGEMEIRTFFIYVVHPPSPLNSPFLLIVFFCT